MSVGVDEGVGAADDDADLFGMKVGSADATLAVKKACMKNRRS